MQLVFLVLSESVDTSHSAEESEAAGGGTRFSISGVIGVVRPLFIPCQYSFTVSVGVRGVDRTVPHSFRLIIRAPNNVQVADLKGTAPPPDEAPSAEGPVPPDDVFGILSFPVVNVPFETEGRYSMDVWFDGEPVVVGAPLPVYSARSA